MSFSTNVPNASQSPGLFPTQNQTNFSRLKTIISTDHVFNNTANVNTDGIHKKVSMQTRTSVPPSRPGGASAVLYTALDSDSNPQLYYWNGIAVVQLTPLQTIEDNPLGIVLSVSLAPGVTNDLYPDPGFRYCGTAYASYQGSSTSSYYNVIRVGSNDIHNIDTNPSGGDYPTLIFTGANALQIKNNDSVAHVCILSLIINRLA